MRWARIQDGVVATIIEAPVKPGGGQWIDATDLVISPGYTWSGSIFEPPVVVHTKIRTVAFWERWTMNERVAYDVASQHNPADTPPQKEAAAKLRLFSDTAAMMGYLILADLTGFMNALSVQIMSPARVTAILSARITNDEMYK